jgi:uncharacterized protein YxjI
MRPMRMDVFVKELNSSFATEFEISTPILSYSARKAMFSLTDKVDLISENGRTEARIRGHFSPLRQKHDFVLSDGRTFAFQCEKSWKGVYSCVGPQLKLLLYCHRGLKYSIFQNDCQIAAITKNRIVFGKGNEYAVSMNSDADLIVILCIVLTINVTQDDDDDAGVTIDLGNLGPQERKFDEDWEPR